MASNYPTSLDTMHVPAATLAGPPTHSDIEGKQNDAIVAVQSELGVDPAGSYATVAARLTDIENQLSAVGTPNWVSFSPNVDGINSFSSGGTGRYIQIGKLVMIMMSGTIASVGSDHIKLNVPVALSSFFDDAEGFGWWVLCKASDTASFTAIGRHNGQKISARRADDNGRQGHWETTANAPTTYSVGDMLTYQGWYETT